MPAQICHVRNETVRLFGLSSGVSRISLLASRLLRLWRERTVTNELTGQTDTLRYLDADHVNHPSGTFAGVTLWSEEDEKLGVIAGVLVDPSTRRVQYFVIERRSVLRPRRYLLPVDSLPVLDADDRKLRVHAKAADLQHYDGRFVEPFSDEDAITAMFAIPAA
jgi:hypothetical protein